MIIAIVLVAVLLLGGGIGAIFLFGGDDSNGSASEGTSEDAAKARADEWATTWATAIKAGFEGPKFQELKTLVCGRLASNYERIAAAAKSRGTRPPTQASITIKSVDVQGTSGTIGLESNINGKRESGTIGLTQQAGEWKVCPRETGSGGGGSGAPEDGGTRIPAPDPN